MRNLRNFVSFVLLSVVILALAACGSSSGTASSDPLSNNESNQEGGSKTGPIFGNVSTVTGKTGITLATDVTTVGSDNGQVVLTARVVNNGAAVPGVKVKFGVLAPLSGPATVEADLTEVVTDSNGNAISRVTTGPTTSTTNVIVSATATIGKQTATANATFQIVRGTGVINVATIPVKTETVDAAVQPTVVFQQQIPVSLTDANGNPRVGAPVTMSIYTKTGTSTATITQQTVATDSSGGAIFNTTVTMPAPSSGTSAVSSIIYKLATSDASPIVAYAASYFTVISNPSAQSGTDIILTTDRTAYDTNDGSVLATAKVTQNGAGVSGVPVKFQHIAGPATIETATVYTDSNGTAITRITTGTVAATTNVIIKATATVGSSNVSAYATFQLVPNLTPQSISTMTLVPEKGVVGINSEILVTATLNTPSLPRLAQNQPITFSHVAGPCKYKNPTTGALVDTITAYTDSNGKAVTTLRVLNINSSTSIILKAEVPVNGVRINAYATLQVVRQNSMIINFITDKDPTDPDGTLNTLSASIPWDAPLASKVTFVQLVPFQVLDQNGIPMPNASVNFTYTSQGRSVVHIYAPTSVTTDDHGMGIMNISVEVAAPDTPGYYNIDAIIYTAKATVNGQNLSSYGGFVATVLREKKP